MKVAPVSGDLVVKLALLAAAGVGAWLLLQRVKAALPTMPTDWPTPTWGWVNPASDQNLAYQGVNSVLSGALGYPETFGGWLADLTSPDPTATPRPPLPDLGTYDGHAYDAMGNVIH